MIYAGIGSRQTPLEVIKLMESLAITLTANGDTLRSGGCEGADIAFETGCDANNGMKEIFYAKDATAEAIKIAMSLHPAPTRCNNYVRMLHGRNVQILLGRNLDKPVTVIYCYIPSLTKSGGTGMGIRIAQKYDIPVYIYTLLDGIYSLELLTERL